MHDARRHARVQVGRAADVLAGNADGVELAVEARRVGARHVEPEEAGVDAARPQGRQQRQEVQLGAADAGDLVDVEDPHGAARSLR